MNANHLTELTESIQESRQAILEVADQQDHNRLLEAITNWADDSDYCEQADAATEFWGVTEGGDEFRGKIIIAG